jgi:hypothetical protein
LEDCGADGYVPALNLINCPKLLLLEIIICGVVAAMGNVMLPGLVYPEGSDVGTVKNMI